MGFFCSNIEAPWTERSLHLHINGRADTYTTTWGNSTWHERPARHFAHTKSITLRRLQRHFQMPNSDESARNVAPCVHFLTCPISDGTLRFRATHKFNYKWVLNLQRISVKVFFLILNVLVAKFSFLDKMNGDFCPCHIVQTGYIAAHIHNAEVKTAWSLTSISPCSLLRGTFKNSGKLSSVATNEVQPAITWE